MHRQQISRELVRRDALGIARGWDSASHDLTLKESAAKIHRWNGRVLVPIYHPSPQVLASHRREKDQLSDYKVVARAIEQADREGESLGFAA